MLALELKERFENMSDLLELAEENVFKIRAYRTAAERVGGLSEEILETYSLAELKKLSGIGQAIAEKIIEYRETGKIDALEKLKRGFPPGFLDLLKIPGLGPKTLKMLWFEYQVKNLRDLKNLLDSGKLEQHFNFGAKKVENLRAGLKFFERQEERIPYAEAREIADKILKALRKCPAAEKVEVAGSLRRKKETIGDIDILACSSDPQTVIECFLALPIVEKVNAHGDTKASVFTKNNRQVDLRVVEPESFGAALQYFTGSKEHNILLRRIAQKKGLLLSEYGLFRDKKKIAGKTEQEIYDALGQKMVRPEERLGKEELGG